MKNLQTEYAGLKLKNPIVISSSSLTNTAEKNFKLEQAGAAAVVLKSIFEEQILLQAQKEAAVMDSSIYGTEGGDYLFEYIKNHTLNEYLKLIADTKKVCTIPVIASINCYSEGNWTEFAKQIESAGADAIELNIMMLPTSKDTPFRDYEMKYIQIVDDLCKTVKIPVTVKLANNVGSLVYLVNAIAGHGAKGVVLFNKLYPFDVDIEKMSYAGGEIIGHNSDLSNGLRWAGIISGSVKDIDCAVSGGVHKAEDVVKAILCGSAAVEVCSILYKEKAETVIPQMLEGLSKWMEAKGYSTVSEFKGKLSATDESISFFERTQFLKYYHG